MRDMEVSNLCETCQKELDCFQKGIFEQENCSDYAPLSLQELLERDKFVRQMVVGTCPNCGSEDTYDCRNNCQLEDESIGHCLDCETYWCIECGYLFDEMESGMECPHWEICRQCSEELGYMDEVEFANKICSSCQHYENGCQLDDPSECEKQWQFLCPYEGNPSECAKIDEFLQEQL